jgi:long-chain acyl-CoA synthetase
MSDPLALFPLALAAGGGFVDNIEAQQWVAAGYTLLRRSARLVRALSAGRSAILLPPGGSFLTALAASDGRGAVLVNPLASPAEIVRQMHDAAVTTVFTNTALSACLPADGTRVLLDDAPRSAIVLVDGSAQTVDMGSHFGIELSGSTDVDGRDEEAVIVYTSAMTGAALGAILTHRNILFNAHASANAMGDHNDDIVLVPLPFAHLFGLVVAAGSPLLRGARVHTMERFHPARAIELIQSRNVTRFMGVPSMFTSMLQVIARREGGTFRSHALRLCFSGGAVVPVELQERWFDATGVELLQGYGLTEAGPAALLTRSDAQNRRGTLGVPIDGTEVSIRDTVSGDAVTDGIDGEMCVKGPHVFRGYVSAGENGLLVRNGWLHTGDCGVKNADGTYSFRGLIKPMFTRNGFNIYPREIEAAFLRMPNVRSVRAWQRPDATKENDIVVRVVGDVAESDVRRWAQQELAAYKQPSHFEIASIG